MKAEKDNKPDREETVTKAANTALDEKVIDFEVKKLGKFSIKPMKLGTMLYISKYSVKIKKQENKTLAEVIGNSKDNIDILCRIVAISILNSKWKIKMFSGILSNRLKWRLNAKELHTLAEAVLSASYGYDFFVTTVLLQGLNVTESKAVSREGL